MPSQNLITDYFVKGKISTCEVQGNLICEESLSSGHRSDFEPFRKLYQTLSYGNDNS